MLSRAEIVAALNSALHSCPHVHACWLGGSDATGRTDELSDIDLLALADDDRVEDTLAVVERTLHALSPVAATYRVPEPTWHGHSQVFIRLERASPFHLIDFCAIKLSSDSRFLEPERHGKAMILFDRGDHLAPVALDCADHEKRIAARLTDLRARFTLFSPFAEKAVRRGDGPEAAHWYFNMTLRMLIDLLRIRYCPDRFDFGRGISVMTCRRSGSRRSAASRWLAVWKQSLRTTAKRRTTLDNCWLMLTQPVLSRSRSAWRWGSSDPLTLTPPISTLRGIGSPGSIGLGWSSDRTSGDVAQLVRARDS